MRIGARFSGKRLDDEILGAFFNFNALVDRQMSERLGPTAWPVDGGVNRSLCLCQLRRKDLWNVVTEIRTRPEDIWFAARIVNQRPRFNRHSSPDRIAVTFCPAEAEGNGVAQVCHCVSQYAELRSVPVLQDDFQPPIVVKIG